MDLLESFLDETNFVVGRMLIEYNSHDGDDETKFAKVSTELSDFVRDVKVDERLPEIVNASVISDLHRSYMQSSTKTFMHEINMYLMTKFSDDAYTTLATALANGYWRAMQANAVTKESIVSESECVSIFTNNQWLISLFLIRMNFFTSIVIPLDPEQDKEPQR
jgi:hypothetical protein